MKVYLFYLDNYIYAFTAAKELAEKFKKQRCMKKLVYRVEKMEDIQWSLFCQHHHSLMLIENPFDTKTGYINLVTTYREDEYLCHFIESLQDAKEKCIYSILDRVGFKKKIDRILREGLEMIYTKNPNGEVGINLNSLEIMIYLFEPTFTGEGELKMQMSRTDFNLE